MDKKLNVTVEKGQIKINAIDISTTSSRYCTARKRYLSNDAIAAAVSFTVKRQQPEKEIIETEKGPSPVRIEPEPKQHTWDVAQQDDFLNVRWADISDSTSSYSEDEESEQMVITDVRREIIESSGLETSARMTVNAQELRSITAFKCFPMILSKLTMYRYRNYLLGDVVTVSTGSSDDVSDTAEDDRISLAFNLKV